MSFPWGSAISAGASIVGSSMQAGSAKDAINAARDQAALDYQRQVEFAQNGIQWRVSDAKAAGIHPIFALGGNTATYTPSAISYSGDTSIGSGLAAAGQDIGRAIDATRSAEDRQTARLQALTLRRAELENDLLASQIAKLNAAPNPPMPASGNYLTSDPYKLSVGVDDGKGGIVIDKPMERTISSPEKPHQEPGALPDVGFVRTPTGLAPVPSKDAKERIEDQAIPEIMWGIRNHVLPSFGYGDPPPQSALPEGAFRWKWSNTRQEWQPEYIGKGTKF